jgi:Tfp pilus assembly protein PilF
LALIENGRPAEGAAILQRDGTHDPDPSTAAERTAAMALAMWRMGNHDQARLLLERATALDPHAPVLPRATDEIQPPTP